MKRCNKARIEKNTKRKHKNRWDVKTRKEKNEENIQKRVMLQKEERHLVNKELENQRVLRENVYQDIVGMKMVTCWMGLIRN